MIFNEIFKIEYIPNIDNTILFSLLVKTIEDNN